MGIMILCHRLHAREKVVVARPTGMFTLSKIEQSLTNFDCVCETNLFLKTVLRAVYTILFNMSSWEWGNE